MPRPILATPPFVIDPRRRYTLAEWQTVEEITGERYEYHEGKLVPVRAMAGGSGVHALIAANVIFSLGALVRTTEGTAAQVNGKGDGKRCGVYSSDLRLMITPEDRYVYPDAAVVCGRPVYDSAVPTAVSNPTVIVEVVSPSSAGFDAGEKFDFCATLESLRDYVLIAQDRPRVEVRSRENAGAPWTIAVSEGMDARAHLGALGDGRPMGEVYRLVEFG